MTKLQLRVLRQMRDEDEELVYERGRGYVGSTPVSGRTFFALLRSMVVSHDPYSAHAGEGLEIYRINETGFENFIPKPRRMIGPDLSA